MSQWSEELELVEPGQRSVSDRQPDRQTGEETDIEGKREEVSEIESDRNIGSGREQHTVSQISQSV